jgi:DNA polymerase III subunit beta
VEQLNIVGKRSGDGFVAHKSVLVSALSRVTAERLELLDLTVGRKGFAGYIRALSGSNIVRIVPYSNGDASESQVAVKRLKVVCGAHTSLIGDGAWVGDKAPYTLAELRVHPRNAVMPNIGSDELAEALGRVLPFTATEDARPVLQGVLFVAGGGKLELVAADGFTLAELVLDFDDSIEGKALIHRDELRAVVGALRKAKRVRLGFEAGGEELDTVHLVIDTEAIRYRWRSLSGDYPNYEPLIPTEFTTSAQLDSSEVLKAVGTMKALADNAKSFALDLTIIDGSLAITNPDGKGEAILPATGEGTGCIRVDGRYLADAMKACGGMVDVSFNQAFTPMLFAVDGFQIVVMPMMSDKAKEAQQEARAEVSTAEPTAEVTEAEDTVEVEPTEAELEAIEAEGEATTEPTEERPKRSRRRKREPVAVA